VIVVDNVVRDGAVVDEDNVDPAIEGTRRLNARMADEPRVSVTEVQTVGVKGHDGFALALVLA
jgi:predicted O-methyltransferase YrrM